MHVREADGWRQRHQVVVHCDRTGHLRGARVVTRRAGAAIGQRCGGQAGGGHGHVPARGRGGRPTNPPARHPPRGPPAAVPSARRRRPVHRASAGTLGGGRGRTLHHSDLREGQVCRQPWRPVFAHVGAAAVPPRWPAAGGAAPGDFGGRRLRGGRAARVSVARQGGRRATVRPEPLPEVPCLAVRARHQRAGHPRSRGVAEEPPLARHCCPRRQPQPRTAAPLAGRRHRGCHAGTAAQR
mmetsp:Transcript_45870/g.116076  ORF Transcript_45870/g.116076 Transcript_45870/m.116076 type:complete len:240 (+) Transcript_45870:1548-2267(+)